jgi:hypothetical protein
MRQDLKRAISLSTGARSDETLALNFFSHGRSSPPSGFLRGVTIPHP